MPYTDQNSDAKPDEKAEKKASRYKARQIAYLFRGRKRGQPADPEKLKTYLVDTQEPFVMAIPIFTDFPTGPTAEDFVYNLGIEPSRDHTLGLHAVTVIGYDEGRKAFRIVNSWGTNWGDKGFLWLNEDFVRDYAIEGWANTPGGWIAKGGARGNGESRPVSNRISIELPPVRKPAARPTGKSTNKPANKTNFQRPGR
jgi:hypothetical protein